MQNIEGYSGSHCVDLCELPTKCLPTKCRDLLLCFSRKSGSGMPGRKWFGKEETDLGFYDFTEWGQAEHFAQTETGDSRLPTVSKKQALESSWRFEIRKMSETWVY